MAELEADPTYYDDPGLSLAAANDTDPEEPQEPRLPEKRPDKSGILPIEEESGVQLPQSPNEAPSIPDLEARRPHEQTGPAPEEPRPIPAERTIMEAARISIKSLPVGIGTNKELGFTD